MTQENWVAIAFWVLAAGLVASALAVVLLPRILHSALALVLAFAFVAGLYVLLSAEFIAAVQIIVYVGAVTVLFLFAIMMTEGSQTIGSNGPNRQAALAALVSVGILALIVGVLSTATWGATTGTPDLFNGPDVTMTIGQLMLSQFFIPFEAAALLLLLAMIGAIVIARPD
jgi:NADH:ubiquinone oxidoreductase subunit 6 (subunit J)